MYGAFWRLYLSPLASFPGPRLAALTLWHEFCYDIVLDGRYTWKLKEYHAKYGPIIRINPYEIHIDDPEFADKVYPPGGKVKTHKWWWEMRLFGQQDISTFDTLDHTKHRMRREQWDPYFSKSSVNRLHPLLIQPFVDKLMTRLAEYERSGKPVHMEAPFSSLTGDVISEYSLPQGLGLLDKPEFDDNHYEMYMAFSKVCHWLTHFGWVLPVMHMTPPWVFKYTNKALFQTTTMQKEFEIQGQHTLDDRENLGAKENTTKRSLLHSFVMADIPESDKTPLRLSAEAQTALGAGTLSSTHCLIRATYEILANPSILDRLMQELETVWPDLSSPPPSLQQLEQIDYLTALMNESLRVFYGIPHRLQRVFDFPLQYRQFTIPPSTPIGMTSVMTHDNPEIFPDPFVFNPDRWLPITSTGRKLEKYLCSFGRGTRRCAGIELGKAEIRTCLAGLFRRFGRKMDMVGVDFERDIVVTRDIFNGVATKESRGLVIRFGEKG